MAAPATITLSVEKMSCAACVGRVDRALVAVPGVSRVAVNLATEEATIDVEPGGPSAADLAETATQAGYPATVLRNRDTAAADARRDATARALLHRVWIAAALALPVVVLEMGGHLFPGFHHLIHRTIGLQQSWILQAAFTTLMLVGPGRAFFTLGGAALRKGAPDMNSLVAIGTGAAYLFSLWVLLLPQTLPPGARAVYFEPAAVIILFILLGRWLEARAKGRTGEAIRALLDLQPKTARVRRGDSTGDIPVAKIVRGDVILLRPGERVPVDGTVTDGTSHLDESMITGEAMPVAKTTGDPVTGGTINGPGALTITATHVGADTVLAGIIRMVQDAQGAKLPIQALVDRVTLWFVPAVLLVALITVGVWLAVGSLPQALVAGVAVLIIACPCAMGLATPTSIMVATGRAAELGVLFRKGDALQALSQVDVVAFDKTGTLTEGRPTLTDFEVTEGMVRDEVLAQVGAVEARVEHPVAGAVVAAAAGWLLPEAQGVRALTGLGAQGDVAGQRVLIGTADLMSAESIHLGPMIARAETLASTGKTVFFAAIDGTPAALIAVSDPIKESAGATISALKAQGLRVAMITGDREATARAVAERIGIEEVIADVRPEGKIAALETYLSQGHSLAFVGDGINDGPALARADVGIAIGTGTDIAIGAADVVLMSGDPRGVATAIRLSRATLRNIRQNLFWAFAYNAALIPVAAGALFARFGLMLSPQLAAAAMALSSLFVLTNAMRLRGLKREAS
ncbi:heavy metal translocating P-type ATPase [uncultured Roseobacter sp.]|uniref:heavy metal translocating P-type ATPase n=1 Tax=uncultured Roseobacter sp. TaxID=114847 RepID=UPI002630FBCE|nr:heavy metal translocating P-type ATPase [uncultured Roseobacter sp.]